MDTSQLEKESHSHMYGPSFPGTQPPRPWLWVCIVPLRCGGGSSCTSSISMYPENITCKLCEVFAWQRDLHADAPSPMLPAHVRSLARDA